MNDQSFVDLRIHEIVKCAYFYTWGRSFTIPITVKIYSDYLNRDHISWDWLEIYSVSR